MLLGDFASQAHVSFPCASLGMAPHPCLVCGLSSSSQGAGRFLAPVWYLWGTLGSCCVSSILAVFVMVNYFCCALVDIPGRSLLFSRCWRHILKLVLKSILKYPIPGVICVKLCSEAWLVVPWPRKLLRPPRRAHSALPSGLWSVQRTPPQSLEQPKFLGASALFYPQGCLLCVASSNKAAWSKVDGDSCLCSALSSTVSLLTPAVAASWGLTVSCIYF